MEWHQVDRLFYPLPLDQEQILPQSDLTCWKVWNMNCSEPKEVVAEGRIFFTIGYSGKSMGAFVDELLQAGVTTLLDIRHLPLSRFRPEFSKRNLATALETNGIRYLHLRELGIPSEIRKRHGYPQNSESLWDWYRSEVVDTRIGDLSWYPEGETELPAMMCVERDPADCHRQRLGQALEARGFVYSGDL